VHPIKRRRDVAAENGADHVIDSAKEDAGYAIKQLTGGRGADVILEMSGYSLVLQASIKGLNKYNYGICESVAPMAVAKIAF